MQSIVPLALLFSIALAIAAAFPSAVSAVNADLNARPPVVQQAARDLSTHSAFQPGG